MDQEARARIAQLNYRFEDLPSEYVETCALCGAEDDFAIISDRDRYGFPVRTYLCRRCGFAFVNPRLTPEGYAIFYDRFYRRLVNALKGREFDITTLQQKQRRYAERIDDVLLGRFLRTGNYRTLLDIGGSTGIVSGYLARKYDLEVTVIEPSPEELAVAEAAGLKTFLGVLEDYPVGEQKFDVILLAQTVHHLQDLNTSFAKMRALSHPETLVFVDMVDFLSICRLRKYSVPDATQVDHCNAMIDPVMRAFLTKHGFRVLLADYSRPMYVNYLLRLSSDGPQMPDSFPYVDEYLRDLVTITNSTRPLTSHQLIADVVNGVKKRIPFLR